MTNAEIASSYDIATLISIAMGNKEGINAPELRIAAASRIEQLRFFGADDIIFSLIFDDDSDASTELRRWLLESWIRQKPWRDQVYWANRVSEELPVIETRKLNQALQALSIIGIPVCPAMEWVEMKSRDAYLPAEDVHQCLSTLAWMGNLPLDVVSTRWRHTVERSEPTLEALRTAWRVLHPNDLDFFIETWAIEKEEHIAGPLLANLAGRFPETTERVMDALAPLLNQYMWFSNYIDGIDSKKLVELTAEQLTTGMSPSAMIASRIERFHLPQQVKGIGRLTTFQKQSVLNALKDSLLRPSNSPGDLRFDTEETLRKESAWKIVCALSISDSRNLLNEAILNEAPHWLAERLVKLASIVSVPDTVQVISQLLAMPPPNYGVTISFLRSLGTIATLEALAELLRFRSTHEAGYPQDWGNAIVSCLYHSGGFEHVWQEYINADDDPDLRQALAYVILDTAEAGIGNELISEVIGLLKREVTIEGAPELILAAAMWSENEPDVALLDILHHAPQVDSLSLAVALLQTGLAERRIDVLSQYGFVHTGQWHFEGPERTWTDYLVRIICNRDQTQQHLIPEFLSSHLSTSPRSRATQLVYGLHLDKWEPATVEAFERLAYGYNSPSTTDSGPFEVLAKAAPDRFAHAEFWSGIQDRLSFKCIEAILKILPDALSQDLAQLPDFTRLVMTDDSTLRHAVAKRIVQARGERALVETYLDAVKHDNIAGSVYLVDVAARILSDDSWRDVEAHSSKHLHPEVRKTAKHGNALRVDVQLAHTYWQRLLDTIDEDIYECFKYANAIVELADQNILELLTQRLDEGVRMGKSSIHSFMREFRDRLEKTAKEKRDKWQKELKLPLSSQKPEKVTVNFISDPAGSRFDNFQSEIAMEFWDTTNTKSWNCYMISSAPYVRFNGSLQVTIELVDDDQNMFSASGIAYWLPEDVSLEGGRLAIEARHVRLMRAGKHEVPTHE
jgi:hypothetical protein